MTAPDYSNYTKAQLQQVLSRIDAQRYPERVREIETRLAAKKDEAGPDAVTARIGLAPVWRRLVAFVVDSLLLSLVGLASGAILHAQFAAMGAWGLMVGFVMSVLYFGLMQSRLRGGQSIGMMLMHIKVMVRDGQAPDVPAALLRAGIFCVAYFLNGASIAFSGQYQWMVIPSFVLIAVLLFSVVYLLLFNRRTGQSLHDLAISAFVVHADTSTSELPGARPWRGHLAVIALVAVITAAGAVTVGRSFTPAADMGEELASVRALQQKLALVPGVDRAGVVMQTMYGDGSQSPTHAYVIQGVINQAEPDPAAKARLLVQVALDSGEEASRQDQIVVNLIWGYNIGIASSWHSTQFANTPAKWREQIGEVAPVAH